uniref:Putative transcription factor gaga-like protein n=1 Tax=Triatoma infestans TaxID=30076 RepID=A0A023EZF6_TRIIF
MGSKRGRLLMRQHRIKKDSDMSQIESEGESLKIERQSSEPSPNLLTVPQHSYLTKQNSSPHLSSTSSHITSQPQSTNSGNNSSSHGQVPANAGGVTQIACVQTSHTLQPSIAETSSSSAQSTIRLKAVEELRRTVSTPQCSNTTSGAEPCEGSRSCHCPVLRPGPALGCNFCWNTIDTHGRILRRKTKYHCPECQTNLCIVPCFQEYHERQCGLISNLSSGTTRESGSGGPSSSCTRGSSPQPSFPTIMKTSSL